MNYLLRLLVQSRRQTESDGYEPTVQIAQVGSITWKEDNFFLIQYGKSAEKKKNFSYLVEIEVLLEHVFTEPDFTESVEKSLVVIVRNSTAILDLSEHVSYTCPYYTLYGTNSRIYSYAYVCFNINYYVNFTKISTCTVVYILHEIKFIF